MVTPPFLPDESKPADSDIVSQYPAVERLFRDIVESWLLIDHDTDGEHTQVTLPELGADPTAVANTGFVYTKDDAADTELFYRDDSGNIVQLTQDGGPGPQMAAFPATTSMLFYQSAAPTGWTKDVAATLGNHAIRVMTDVAWSGGSKGATAFDSVFGAGKTAGATTLTAAQSGLPAHLHSAAPGDASANNVTGGNPNFWAGQNPVGSKNTGSTGGDAAAESHNHTLSLDLNYINVIRATKD
ncbi:hypothetical protein LCGC14_1522000 [marine sediment metagenome]|uniref:Phage tail collar domain-containing protein n=1 Tax=marine sediment metagenome TaxID=412755 RepID=A0A0F9IYL3_9ZZZZ